MKFSICILFCTINIINSCAQNVELNAKVNNLRFIKEMPYEPELSGDSLFWVVIKAKIDIVPYLIQKLTDTTITEAPVPNFGGYYTVADIACSAISEIIHNVPILEFAEDSINNEQSNGYWGYWNYTRRSFENRVKFKNRIYKWYFANITNFEWVKNNQILRNSPDWKFQPGKHPSGGFYQLRK